MTAQELASKYIVVKHFVGSKLYGTSLPTSDEDISGIFVPPLEYYLGMKTIDQVTDSHVEKDERGKNTKEAVDIVYYSIKRFFQLSLDNSPNMLERFFIPDDKIIEVNSTIWNKIKGTREYFISQKLIPRFMGYAVSQKHKMILRSDKWQVYNSFYTWLKRYPLHNVLIEIKTDSNHLLFGEFKGDNFVLAPDFCLQKTISIKKALDILKEKIDLGTNRQDTILKYGFDTKFASHLIRLLHECIELLKTGKLEFPLKSANEIKDIKEGKLKVHDVLNYATELENAIRNYDSYLPLEPDYKYIDQVLVEITKDYLGVK